MKSRRFSLLRSVILTRRTATVTISAPLASTAARVSAKSRYLPVPTISREVKTRPASSKESCCIIESRARRSAARTPTGASPASNEIHDFDPVTGLQRYRVVLGARHDRQIDLDGDPPATHLQPLEQCGEAGIAVHQVVLAV